MTVISTALSYAVLATVILIAAALFVLGVIEKLSLRRQRRERLRS